MYFTRWSSPWLKNQDGRLKRQKSRIVNREPKESQKGRLNASNVGERLRDEGEFIPFPSSAVLFFSETHTSDGYLSGLHTLDWSLPGVPQTAPLCLGNLERELIVFKVPWQESDAHSRWVLSPHRQLGAQLQRMPVVSRFCSGAPRCETGHKSCFIGQWLSDLWDSEVPNNNVLHGACWCRPKRCVEGLEISSAASLSNPPP